MTLSVQLSPVEETLLEQIARQLGRSKSDLARQAIHELCQKLTKEVSSPYSLGEDLFGAGKLADSATNSMKKVPDAKPSLKALLLSDLDRTDHLLIPERGNPTD